MNTRKVRVITAPESTGVCQLVRKMVVAEGGVAGKKGDSHRPMTLIMDLDPEVAIIDCSVSPDNRLQDLPLSGMDGMDIARMITQEIPGRKVVLLNNQALVLSGAMALTGYTAPPRQSTAIDAAAASIYEPRGAEEAPCEALPPGRTNPFDVVMFCGACGVALGWFLLIAMISFTGGGIVAMAGALTIVLGFTAKHAVSFWQRLREGRS